MAASNNYKLYSRDWRDDLRKFLSGAKQLTIVSPYIGHAEAKLVVNMLPEANITTITRLKTSSLLGSKALNIKALQALKKLKKSSNKKNIVRRIVNLPWLHAKIYVADKKRAIITSANLTKSGIDLNHECGIVITNRSAVSKICTKIDSYIESGVDIEANELNVIERTVRVAENTKKKPQSRKACHTLDYEYQCLYSENNMNMRFRKAVYYLLGDKAMTTVELNESIQCLYPDIYDKDIYRNIKRAQKYLEKRGVISCKKKWRKKKWISKDIILKENYYAPKL